VLEIIKLATGGLKPDLTLFFDISVENAIRRMAARIDAGEKKNRMDDETGEFYSRVRDSYMEIAHDEPERFRILDANGSIEEIHAEVVRTVTEFLNV
jgi:dTMP kinase